MAHTDQGQYVRTQLTARARSLVNSDAQLQNRDNRDVVSEACDIYAEVRPQLQGLADELEISIPEAIRRAVAFVLAHRRESAGAAT